MKENAAKLAIRIAVTVFMWIPGVMPVNVPIAMPMRIARARSSMNVEG